MHILSLNICCVLIAQLPTAGPTPNTRPATEQQPLQFQAPRVFVEPPVLVPLKGNTRALAPPARIADPPAVERATPTLAQPARAESNLAPTSAIIPDKPRTVPVAPRPDGREQSAVIQADAVEPNGPRSTATQTNATQPLSSSASDGTLLAKEILLDALADTRATSLKGTRIPMLRVLEGNRDRDQQRAGVKAYWRAALSVADLHHATDEVDLLAGLSAPVSVLADSQLRAVRSAALARKREALLAAVASQYDLAEQIRWSNDNLPLPSDRPVVGRYKTRFAEMFVRRTPPSGIRRINDMLPHYLHLIHARASAVESSRELLYSSVDSYQSGQLALSEVLRAFSGLRDQRISFLAAVRDYNAMISDYALTVVGPSVSRHDLVSTLVVNKSRVASTPSTTRPSLIRSGVPNVPSGAVSNTPPSLSGPPSTPRSAIADPGTTRSILDPQPTTVPTVPSAPSAVSRPPFVPRSFSEPPRDRQPSSIQPSNSLPNNSFPNSSPPMNRQPIGVLPNGDFPNSNQPSNALPKSGLPASSQPNAALPNSNFPNGNQPSNTFPKRSLPGSSQPNNALPNSNFPNSNQPSNTLPNSSLPRNALPNSSFPNNLQPRNTIPNSSPPNGNFPNSGQAGGNSFDSRSAIPNGRPSEFQPNSTRPSNPASKAGLPPAVGSANRNSNIPPEFSPQKAPITKSPLSRPKIPATSIGDDFKVPARKDPLPTSPPSSPPNQFRLDDSKSFTPPAPSTTKSGSP